MSDTAQKRALRNYRSRLTKRGIARFEPRSAGRSRAIRRREAEFLRRCAGRRWWVPISNSRVPGKPAARLTFDPLPSRHKHHQQYNEAGPVRIVIGMDGCAIRWRLIHLLPDGR